MKYNVKLNGKIYEVEVEKGVASLLKEYDAISAPAPVLPAQPAAPAACGRRYRYGDKGRKRGGVPSARRRYGTQSKRRRQGKARRRRAHYRSHENGKRNFGKQGRNRHGVFVQKGSKVEQGTPIYELA